MKVVIISNYLNHHMLPLCLSFEKLENIDFTFIATETMKEERNLLGYKEFNDLYDFVLCAYKSNELNDEAIKLCYDCDVLIYGSAPEIYVKKRLKRGKLTFRYSERVYKRMCPKWQIPLRAVKYYWQFGRFKNLYLLCASAYTASDYAKTGTFKNKAYKWGYFPEKKNYEDINVLINNKNQNSILWAGRLIDWKHPDIAIEVAHRLKSDGYNFILNIIGNGEMETILNELIVKYNLEDNVKLLGSMSPDEVREYMEKSQVYLFTSDRNEGWGVVLNESMNSACAIVANRDIGSVPYLIKDGVNGYSYQNGDIETVYLKTKELLMDAAKRQQFGKNAYESIDTMWNANNAATRLIELSDSIIRGDKVFIFENDVCSKS